MEKNYQVVIIGGGLGGLTAAIHLTKNNVSCLVIEKSSYPAHKVCGEYVSNEVLPYLNYLDIYPHSHQAKSISKYFISTKNGKSIKGDLKMGGFGISRYCLDYLMYKQLIKTGGLVVQDQVVSINFSNDEFKLLTLKQVEFKAQFVIGAFGKRSNLDKFLGRKFIKNKSQWLAIKGHYKADFDDNLVELHNFNGGYCGLSKVENDAVNACYLVSYDSFKKVGEIDTFQQQVMSKNPYLKDFFKRSEPLFKEPLSISQVSFDKKTVINNHILMVGDTAGLIHPLCGNGMAMAIHAGKLCAEQLVGFYNNLTRTRKEVEMSYLKHWNKNFNKRLSTGSMLSKVFLNKHLATILMRSSRMLPGIVPQIINKTHGKHLNPEVV